MKIKLKIFLIICAFAFQANAQTYFNRLYDYKNDANFYWNAAGSVYEYSNGEYLISGQKFFSAGYGALHFIKINVNGDTICHKRYPDSIRYFTTGASGSLVKTFDNNVVQVGASANISFSYDAFIEKLTEDGDTLWTKTYGGANFDNANIVHQTADSGFVLMGVTQSFGMGGSDYYLIKTDKNGNFEWQRTYGTSGTEDCLSGDLTLDGGFILSGQKNGEFHIVKTDSNGNQQWTQTYSGTSGPCFIKQLADSSYILTGAKIISGFAGQAYMIKINKTGGIVWQNHYGSPTVNDWFYTRPVILNDGSIVIAGQQMLGSIPIGMLVKTDSMGNQIWLRTYYANPTNDNYVYDVKATSDGGFILVGSGNVTGQDAWVVKVDSVGCEIANCNVGVEELEIENGGLKIYPNPASEYSTVEIRLNDENRAAEFIIYNILGSRIYSQQVKDNDVLTIDNKELNNGIYLYVLKTNNEIIEKQKVIISK